MKTLPPAVIAILLLVQCSDVARSENSEWEGASSSAWGDPSNWTAGIPKSNDTTAEFGGLSMRYTVDLGGSAYIVRGVVCSGNPPEPYVFQNGVLVLDVNTDSEREGLAFQARLAETTIKADLEITNSLADAQIATVFLAERCKLTIAGNISANTPTTLRPMSAMGEEGTIVVTGIISGSSPVASAGNGTVRVEGPYIADAQFATWGGITQLARPDGPVFDGPAGSVHIIQGTLELAANDQINRLLVVNETGILDLNGHSNSSSGTLLVLGDASIDFSDGAAEALSFAESTKNPWEPGKRLTVVGFAPGKDKLRFGSAFNGLTPQQVSQINFDGRPAGIDEDGFVNPE